MDVGGGWGIEIECPVEYCARGPAVPCTTFPGAGRAGTSLGGGTYVWGPSREGCLPARGLWGRRLGVLLGAGLEKRIWICGDKIASTVFSGKYKVMRPLLASA